MQDAMTETVGFRLSPQQEQLLALDHDPGAVQCAARLEAGIDAARLQDALSAAASRHEILRTTFVKPAGMRSAQQVIAEHIAPSFSTGERGAADPRRDAAALAELLEAAARDGFDLERGPLVRALLLPADGEEAGLLVLTASAACADPASLLVLLGETCDAYCGAGAGDDDPVQYADYAQWRHELLADEEPDAVKGRSFWQDDAADRPEAPRILFGRRATAPARGCRAVAVDLGPVEAEALRRASDDAGVTVPVFLEAAWHGLLARLSAATEVLSAEWLDGRAQPDLIGAVGPYAQPVPIRSRLQEGTSFAEVLDQVRRSRATATRWQDCATADDLAALTEQPWAGFAHLMTGALKPPVTGIAALGPARPPVALLLGVREAEARLDCEIQYDPAAFDRRDAEEVARRFAILLGSTLADPAQPVSRLAIVEGPERAQLIAAARGADAPAPAPAPVHHQFEAQAARAPELAAVAGVGEQMSYAELNEAANRLAHHLRAAGATPGLPVGLCMERTPAMLVALLAILKQGGAYLPLNFEHPQARISHQLDESGARVLLTEAHLLDRLPAFDGAVVCVDRDAEAIASCPPTNPEHLAQPEDLVYVMYTSGSTGTPKGVAVTHANLANYAASIAQRLRAGDAPLEGLRYGVVSAISTDLGNTSIFAPLVTGGCVRLISAGASMDGDALAAELDGQRLDVIKITPSHLRALLAGDAAAALPRRWLVLGGEALSWDLIDAVAEHAPECRILNHYGPTETTVGCCTYLVDGDRRGDSLTVPIGFPLAGARAYVLDQRLEPLPAGVPGELCIAGAGVAKGYAGASGDGGDRFTADPFADDDGQRMYRTGDRARRLRDGALEFLGRVDEQVKIRGFRIEPGEIEAALVAHPAIRQAAVSAEDDGRGGLRLVAYLVTSEVPPVEELEAFLARSLPDYMVPSAFATVEALPFTPSGKIDRQALPGLAEVQTRRSAEYVAPRDEIEEEIAAIWRELLGVERVGVNDDFFALGGHSLLATQAIMRIRRAHGDIPLRALLAAPTVGALAEVVRAAGGP